MARLHRVSAQLSGPSPGASLLLCSFLWAQLCSGQPAYTSQGTHVFRSLDVSPDGKDKCLGLLPLGGGNAIADIDCPADVPLYLYNIPDILWDFQKLTAGPTANSYQFQCPAYDSSNYQGMRLALCAQTNSCGGCPDKSRLGGLGIGKDTWVNCTSGTSYAYYPGQTGISGAAQDLCWSLTLVTAATTGTIVQIQPCNGALATQCLAFSGVLDNIPSYENSVSKPWHQRALLRPCSATKGWQLMNVNRANTLEPYLASLGSTPVLPPALPATAPTSAPLLPVATLPAALPTGAPAVISKGNVTARTLALGLSATTNLTALPSFLTTDCTLFAANTSGPLTLAKNLTVIDAYLVKAQALASASNPAANTSAPVVKQSVQPDPSSAIVTVQFPALQHFVTVWWVYLNSTIASPTPEWYAKSAYFFPAPINTT